MSVTSPIRATAILAAASAATVACGILTAKAYAILVGPAGFGEYALLRSTLSLAVLVGGLGIGVILVRIIAQREAVGDAPGALEARRAGRIVALGGGVLAAIILLVLGTPLGQAIGIQADGIAMLAPATILSVAAGVETATLNGHHRVTALATVTAVMAITGAVASVVAVALLGTAGIALGLLAASAAGFVVAVAAVRISVPAPAIAPSPGTRRSMARTLLTAGIPYTASSLAGTGAQLALPLVVGVLATQVEVGFYRAASAISIGYLGFLLRAMSQDYYPRLAATTATPDRMPVAVNEQLKLVLALSTPIIFTSLALSGPLVTVLYSSEFGPASDLLHWQLAGDLLKLPAWTLSFVVLASGRSMSILGMELVGGGMLVASTVVGMAVFGLTGAGVAYLVTYAVYYPVSYWLATRYVKIRLNRLHVLPVGMAGVVAAAAAAEAGFQIPWLVPISCGAMAVAATMTSLRFLLGKQGRVLSRDVA